MNLLHELRSRRLLAIVRGADPDAALRSVLALAEEGVSLIEVSLTTRDALNVMSQARAELGAAADVGAGTVVTAQDARRAREAGARFVVTPAVVPGAHAATELGLPLLCGALSPTEVAAAAGQGATAVKLFPASLGGPAYLRALRDPFPAVPLVPVGGLDADTVREFLAAGATAVGVGGPLLGDAASGGSLAELRVRARRFLAAVGPPAAASGEVTSL
ncbi:MAG: bifunctional 4-hydroxy-2-oxoglutarate aldolase/2-dehydro-3-deoxy-phosphogluconate aldolase [Streptosporangiaceae bacterium]